MLRIHLDVCKVPLPDTDWGTQVSKDAHARPSRLHHAATCLKNICLIGIKAGSHWTIKDSRLTLGSISIARPKCVTRFAGRELQKVQSHQKVRCKP